MLAPSSSSGRKAARFFAVAAVASMLLMGVHVTSATPGVVDVPIGKNYVFATSEINTGSLLLDCTGSTCSYDTNAGTASSSIVMTDQNGAVDREATIGYAFNLIQACQGQSTAAGFLVTFNYAHSLTTNKPLLVTGAATATVTARTQDGTGGTPTTATGTNSAATWTTGNINIATGTTYEATLGAKTHVTMQDSLVPGETITADADLTMGSVSLDFKDSLPPGIASKRLDPEGLEASGNFLGYVSSADARIKVRAEDPIKTPAGVNVGQSCVDDITFTRNGASHTVQVPFDQGEVSSEPISGDGRFTTTVLATDYAGHSSSSTLDFVLDTVAPGTTVAIDGAPNGNAPWYKAPGPKWNVACQRDPNGIGEGNTAPCKELRLSTDGGTSYANLGSGPSAQRAALDGSSVQVQVRSIDRANNMGAWVPSTTISVDTVLPLTAIDETTTDEFGNGWYAAPTTLDFRCVSDATSGCGLIELSINGGAYTTLAQRSCSVELDESINYHIDDIAGNRVQGPKHFGCDFTAPSAIANLAVSSATFFNDDVDRLYANVTPTWSWDAASDPVSNGVASLVRGYEVFVNGGSTPVFVSSPTITPGALKDGTNCIQVRSVDNAGNRGTLTDSICVFLDRVAPIVNWNLPKANTLHHAGMEVGIGAIQNAPSDMAIVVGDIVSGITATDSPRAAGEGTSKLWNVQLIEHKPANGYHGDVDYAPADGTNDRRHDGEGMDGVPCDDLNVASRTCSWNDNGGSGAFDVGVAPRLMYARAWDNANNLRFAFRNYTRVDVAAVETVGSTACQLTGNTCNQLYWATAPATDFLSYQVHIGTTPSFAPSPLNQISTILDRNTAKYEDIATDNAEDIDGNVYYKVLIVKTDSTRIALTTVKVRNQNVAGTVGQWV